MAESYGCFVHEPGLNLEIPGKDGEPEGLFFLLRAEVILVGEEGDFAVRETPAQLIDGTEQQGPDAEVAELAANDKDVFTLLGGV